MSAQLLTTSPVIAETDQDVLVGEKTIASKVEDPLKEYKEKSQNPVSLLKSDPFQIVPEAADTEIGNSSVPEVPETVTDVPTLSPRGGGGIMPLAGNVLVEGLPGDPFPYDIDKNFADVIRSIYPLAPNPMTDDFMESLTDLEVSYKNLNSLKGIEFATNLTRLICSGNQLDTLDVSNNLSMTALICNSNKLTALDVSNNIILTNLNCASNKIDLLDVSNNTLLSELHCGDNQLSLLDVSNNTGLTKLNCSFNQLNTLNINNTSSLVELDCARNKLNDLDVSSSVALEYLRCFYNQIAVLDLNQNPHLIRVECFGNQLSILNLNGATGLLELVCYDNQLTNLDVSNNSLLTLLSCENNKLSILDVSNNSDLSRFSCGNNQLTNLDISNNNLLTILSCGDNKLSALDVSSNTGLNNLECSMNQLISLDVSNNNLLTMLSCGDNKLSTLDVSNNVDLYRLDCSNNQLKNIDISNNVELTYLYCFGNLMTDITSAMGLTKLTELDASSQKIFIPVPVVLPTGETEIDILKTTAHAGLSANNVDISPAPIFNYSGDSILLSNVTRESLSEKSINFSYNSSDILEGAASGTKQFSGTITFYTVSDLANELKYEKAKIKSGGEIEWTWTITSLTTKKAENIEAILDAPSGLNIVSGSIHVEKNGVSQLPISDLEVVNNLGELDQGDEIVITFSTIATGNPEEWLEIVGKLDWEDDTVSSPHTNQSKGSVQILDEEQAYFPKETKDLALISTPICFNYGIQDIEPTAKTYTLHSANYQTNTNVVTKGFYIRIKDDRSTSTGWKLSASLSDFKDNIGTIMPNSSGTQLKLENLSVECITDRDTPQEAIVPSPTGTPSSVQTTETLVVGQTAKTLISAQSGEGQGTWQLRMPFDKISLNLPANAGKKSTNYQAKLTWSLDDTP